MNGVSLEGKTHDEVVKMLQASKGVVKFLVARLPLEAIQALTEVCMYVCLRVRGWVGLSVCLSVCLCVCVSVCVRCC